MTTYGDVLRSLPSQQLCATSYFTINACCALGAALEPCRDSVRGFNRATIRALMETIDDVRARLTELGFDAASASALQQLNDRFEGADAQRYDFIVRVVALVEAQKWSYVAALDAFHECYYGNQFRDVLAAKEAA